MKLSSRPQRVLCQAIGLGHAKKRYLWSIWIFAMCLLAASPAASRVDITDVSDSQVGCTTLISGEISAGDADRIRSALLLKGATRYVYEERICFDSIGGSFLEGINIARMLDGARTGVDEFHKCLSACFIAFMGGTLDRQEDRPLIADRVMHPTSRVGFHAPGLQLSKGMSFTTEQINSAWETALLATAEIVKFRYENRDYFRRKSAYFFRDELLEEMLRTPPREMRIIETVGDALFYNIIVFPVILPDLAINDLSVFSRVCRALGIINEEFDINDEAASPKLSVEGAGRWVFTVFTGAFDPGESETTCTLRYGYNGETASDGEMGSAWELGSMQAEDWWIPPNDFSIAAFMHYPIETRIADLPTKRGHATDNDLRLKGLRDAVANASAQGVTGRDSLQCWLTSTTARVTNVDEYTNLRRQPDLSAAVISQVPLGDPVQALRADNITVIGQERDRQSCINACRTFGADREGGSARDLAQQCINGNMIWYEITDSRGNRGWVSRKFLEEEQ
jgi:hypothetical protein